MTVAPKDSDSDGAPSDPAASPGTDLNETPGILVGQTQQLPRSQQLPPAQAFSSLPPPPSSITGAYLEPVDGSRAADVSRAADTSGAADVFGVAPTVRDATPEWPQAPALPSSGIQPGESAATGSLGYSPPAVAPPWPTQSGWPVQPVQPVHSLGQQPYPTPGWGPQPYQPGTPTAYQPNAYQPAAWGYAPGFAPIISAASGPQPGLEWGGVGARFWALIVDVFVFVGVFMVWALGTAALGIPTEEVDGVSPPATLWFTWFLLIMALIYHPVCWYVWGASPGQKALGLRVARSSNGQRLGVGSVLVRYLVFSIETWLLPLGIIAAISTANDPFKRAWHDTAAKSVVVRRL